MLKTIQNFLAERRKRKAAEKLGLAILALVELSTDADQETLVYLRRAISYYLQIMVGGSGEEYEKSIEIALKNLETNEIKVSKDTDDAM